MVLGAILGPLAETSFMTTMISFSNDWTVFFTRPISGAIMAMVASWRWSIRSSASGAIAAALLSLAVARVNHDVGCMTDRHARFLQGPADWPGVGSG